MITKVERVHPDGRVEVLETASTRAEQVISENTAAQVTHALRRVVTGGTGRAADFGVPIAGKTGTTNDVIALGGYVTAEDGEVLAFYFTFNGRDRWNARATIDAMGATLAGFAR